MCLQLLTAMAIMPFYSLLTDLQDKRLLEMQLRVSRPVRQDGDGFKRRRQESQKDAFSGLSKKRKWGHVWNTEEMNEIKKEE